MNMKQTTSERLNIILHERNLRQADVLEMIKPYCEKYNVRIPRNALSQYFTGKVVPKQDKLAILGMALNVSSTQIYAGRYHYGKTVTANLLDKKII